ncbi:class I SAM-dependent methyltransferase [Catenuloplanes indicus]|uniref:SAM-dependent methyltransferase n=1 Tax=Catenuloplanes indicus TaxID=137267 RepID=A0AAE4AV38_9ACTN|nr:class I SAM-dependent methyltransferase [Catenuloplanes indicus]MDQ0363544.1 SAM-dependent methyltransferase [Catenuloplanes indicus]
MDHTAYDAQAEHYDLLTAPMWSVLAPLLSTALRGLDPRHGPAADIGAGSGRGTALLARLHPHLEVIAVEPSASLRTALFTRVGGDVDLSRRVTVLADTAAGAVLPPRLSAVLLANAVSELSPRHRRDLWRTAAQRLAPGAPLVVNLGVPGGEPQTVVRVGRREYRNTGEAEPGEPGTVRWTITTEVRDGDTVVQRVVSRHVSWRLTTAELCRELAAAGFGVRRTGVVVVART